MDGLHSAYNYIKTSIIYMPIVYSYNYTPTPILPPPHTYITIIYTSIYIYIHISDIYYTCVIHN